MQVGKNLYVNADIYQLLDRLTYDCGGKYFQMGYKEASDYLMVQCPYHKFGQEHKPSAQFRKEDGLFYCFTCKVSHSFPKVVSDVLKLNGVKWLKENFETDEVASFDKSKFKLKTKEEKKDKPIYINPEALKKYKGYSDYMLKTRHISKEVLDFFDVGYDAENDCVTFPVKDIFGRVLFIATRNTKNKFFHYPEGVEKPVYGLYELEKARKAGRVIDKVYVVESMIDALSIWTWGGFAIAMNGTGSKYQYEQIMKSDIKLLILATDNDQAGWDAREKFRENVKGKFIKEIDYESYEACKDINEFTEEQFHSAKIVSKSLFKDHKKCSIIKNKASDTLLQKELVKALYLMGSHWDMQSDDMDERTNFIYDVKTVEEIKVKCVENKLDLNYVLHRWYNVQTSLMCEDMFIKYGAVDEKNTKDKLTDFYIDGEPFDLKVTAFPDKLKATSIDMKSRKGRNTLIEWFYRNQSQEGRKGFGNRIFIVCGGCSTKNKLYLKSRFELIEPRIKAFMEYSKEHPFNTLSLNDGDITYPSIRSDIIYIPEELAKENDK